MNKLITIIMMLAASVSFSQTTYQQGYFIDNTGMRTDCLIKNLGWKNNPQAFDYKLSADDEPKVKRITEVSEFSVSEAYKFKRFTVQVDRSGSAVNNLSDKKEPEWQTETLFLKLLVEGNMNLYQYEDNNLSKYFYSSGDHKSAGQLLFKEYNAKGGISQNNFYRQQLFNLMSDKYTSESNFTNLKYNKDALVKLFKAYNGNTNAEVKDFTGKQNQGSLNFTIRPGANSASIDLEHNGAAYLNSDLDSKVTFRIGLELEYVLPFNNNKWSIFIDPNYQQYKSSSVKYSTMYAINYRYIEIPVGIRHYFYLNNSAKVFINAAYVPSMPVSKQQLEVNNTPSQEIARSSNFAFGAGFAYGRFSAELRYNTTREILDYSVTKAAYNNSGIILGYKVF